MSLSAKAKPFKFSGAAAPFVPGSFAPKAPTPSQESAPEPAPTPTPAPVQEVVESWDEPSSAIDEKQQTEKLKLDEVDDMDDVALLEELKNNPELAAELAAVQKEEEERAARKQAADARRAEKAALRKANKKAANENLSKCDEREHLNIVFIGHVDAGKSTISGQIMLATGQIDERTIAKYKKEAEEKGRDSWYLAFILDTNDEEKAKGKTVEVGRAQFTTKNKRYTLLDAPGHKNYVPNMIGGAQQADVGVLVISARRGEFETGFDRGGQTREHAMLAKTLGIKRLVVLVNKMDEKTVKWSKERYDAIEQKLSPFLKRSGFNLKTDVIFCPVSGYSGANIKDRYEPCEWYSGPSFLEILDLLPPIKRDHLASARIPIITRFKDMGSLMLLGKLEAGTIKKGETMILMPPEKEVQVLGISVDEEEVDIVSAGENCLVKVKGVEEDDVNEGMVLCGQKGCAIRTRMFDCQIQVMDLLAHKPILTAGYQAVLHIHTLVMECEIIRLIEDITNVKVVKKKKAGKKGKKGKAGKKGKGKKGGKKKAAAKEEPTPAPVQRPRGPRPRMLKSGMAAVVRIRTQALVCVEKFADQPAMGRFTLRDEGITIAIGKIMAVQHGHGASLSK